jgi:hypothetical protein
VIRDNMISVSRGDNVCATYAECLPFLAAGKTIAYRSATRMRLNLREVREGGGDPSIGVLQISRWSGGNLVRKERLEVDLLR